ncbi:MAG: IS4 family transposase [Dehalococcoidia bacterium]|nr:MAG: IS4 family transposase [Dehalococcoidia bacterium]
MRLSESLTSVAASANPGVAEQFRQHIDPAWVEEALRATGTATIRHRRLPAPRVAWLVIAMALFRNRPITEVADKLDLALPGRRGPTASSSAITQARVRLGEEPLEWLFGRTAQAWAYDSADRHRWRGLALYGVDGTTLRVPDSEENRTEFGVASGGHRGNSGYPLVRLVALMVLRSHLLATVRFGAYAKSEHAYATDLWSGVPDNSLTIVDRGFLAAGVLVPLHRDGANRHWLTRGKKNLRWRTVERLGRHDELVEMKVSSQARKHDPALPKTWIARAIRYQRKGYRPQVLLTSLLDPVAYPASEIVELYHERWELELGYDEIKTEMLEREETLRSRSPVAIRQEIWGVLIAYNLVRLEMEGVADEAHVEPTRISFVVALRLICDEWSWCAIASPGAIPRHLSELRASLQRFILPPRRTERSYPRAVKIKMSNYAKKRRPDQTTTNTGGPK